MTRGTAYEFAGDTLFDAVGRAELRLQLTGGLEAWMPVGMAVNAVRALRLQAARYQVYLRTIPEEITPQNRL
ncbi:MAG TPA: hypothetical protein VFN74_03235, partial [Chloroflexota bacterium]|nr:hypothetical protein [Chloroflexota bacterium]